MNTWLRSITSSFPGGCAIGDERVARRREIAGLAFLSPWYCVVDADDTVWQRRDPADVAGSLTRWCGGRCASAGGGGPSGARIG